MTLFKCVISVAFIYSSCCYSQMTLSGRFVQPNETNFDSARVLIEEATRDTIYASAWASKDGSFLLKTSNSGMLMAQFSQPHFRTLRVALLSDQPEQLNVDVTLWNKVGPYDNCNIVFHDPSSLLAKFALLQFKGNYRLNKPTTDSINWKAVTRTIEEALATEKEPILRQELILQYVDSRWAGSPGELEESIKKWTLEIPPTSPVWVYHSNMALVLSRGNREEPYKLANEILTHHPNMYFVKFLYKNAQWSSGFKENASSQSNWASGNRPFIPTVRVGEAVPHFAIRSMDDTSKTFSERSMIGQVYLIDFWATWCGSCIFEIPYLQKAFERFKSQGFTILSVSDDDSASTVLRYRNHEGTMRWDNALGSSQSNESIMLSFGVSGIPFPVLVSAQGTILALGDDLKGENLQPTLEKFIGN
jgi:thiol-disulfide isomerase/thioredoxin